jgi:hypothetical protein
MMMAIDCDVKLGAYEVVTKTCDFPVDFWAVRCVAGRILIESSEEESMWVSEDKIQRALERGYIRLVE